MKKTVIIFSLIIFAAGVRTASADLIYLKSGRVIKGKVIHRTPIYIRLEPRFLGDPDREFLVENVDRVVEGDETLIPTEDVINYVSNLDEVPLQVQLAVKQMAVSLLEQAMQSVDIPNLADAPENVKRVAEQKATDLLAQAMTSLNDTPSNVKDAARQIANSLLEETVRTTSVSSINAMPNEVKKAAQEKASALIEQAMVDSVEDAPNQVKLAAQLKARALIEDAMKEINILDRVIEEGKSVQEEYELSSMIQRNKQLERKKITTFEREVAQSQIDAIMDEAVQRRIDSTASRGTYEVVQGTNGLVEKMVIPPQSETEIADLQVTAEMPLQAETGIVEEGAVGSGQEEGEIKVLTKEELSSRIAAIPQPKLKGLSFTDFVFALTYRDYLAMGLCIVLLLVLLSQRAKSRKTDEHAEEDQDNQVVSSVTFQHLPEDVKSKFTSSDISLILDLEGKFRKKIDKSSGEVVIDDENLIKFIQEQAKKYGGRFTFEDLKKVLETKEKTITETGLA